jgi:ATP-dependent helicase Lhr and Lhr-like helicase
LLRSVRRLERSGEVVRITATDPLNLVGVVLPGPRIPALPTNSVTYVDGVLASAAGPASQSATADREAGEGGSPLPN